MTGAGLESLRERAASFVATHGDPVQRARAAVLAGDAPVAAAVAAIAARLEAAPSRDAAAGALAALGALGVRRGVAVDRAVALLGAAQAEDGSWPAAPDGGDEARAERTAAIAGLLAATACARPATLHAAGAFLAAGWRPERVEAQGAAALAAHTAFFANAAHPLADEALQWCGRALEKGFRSGAVSALDTARVLLACDAPALPGARLDPAELVASLVAAQAPDGGFESADADPGARVEATLDALAALRLLAPAQLGRRR